MWRDAEDGGRLAGRRRVDKAGRDIHFLLKHQRSHLGSEGHQYYFISLDISSEEADAALM